MKTYINEKEEEVFAPGVMRLQCPLRTGSDTSPWWEPSKAQKPRPSSFRFPPAQTLSPPGGCSMEWGLIANCIPVSWGVHWKSLSETGLVFRFGLVFDTRLIV